MSTEQKKKTEQYRKALFNYMTNNHLQQIAIVIFIVVMFDAGGSFG
jgi:hypothetical protein